LWAKSYLLCEDTIISQRVNSFPVQKDIIYSATFTDFFLHSQTETLTMPFLSKSQSDRKLPSRSLSIKDIDHLRKMEHKSSSTDDLPRKSESWSNFHETLHSEEFRNSGKFKFKISCSRPSFFANILKRHTS